MESSAPVESPAEPTTSDGATEQPTASAGPGQPADGVDCSSAKCVALTFDDGPSKYTPRLIDELNAAGAKATFFILGDQAKAYPEVVRSLVNAGMAIGNHSVAHRNMARMSLEEQRADIAQASDAIEKAGGVRPTTFRPPYGSTNEATSQLGVPLIMWNVDTEDWKNKSVEETTRRAVDAATPGAIILMHDIHPTTVQAVPGIIGQLKAAGYTLVTVPQLFGGKLEAGQRYYSQGRVR